jgi:hypothetical protein
VASKVTVHEDDLHQPRRYVVVQQPNGSGAIGQEWHGVIDVLAFSDAAERLTRFLARIAELESALLLAQERTVKRARR